MKPMNDGVHVRAGADSWQRPLDAEDREFLRCADINIEPELEKYCSAAVPLQWFSEADFKVLESAVAVARLLAERELKQDNEQARPEPAQLSPTELTARKGEVLRLYAFQFYTPLLTLILYRTACCSVSPQRAWNSPLTAGRWFGRVLDLVHSGLEQDAYDSIFISLVTAVEMSDLSIGQDDEPGFRDAILLWDRYQAIIVRSLTSRGLRINGATVRACDTVEQAIGCLRLGAHPSSVVAALSGGEDFRVGELLELFARACVACHVSPVDACAAGNKAAEHEAIPHDANCHDDLLAPLPGAEEMLPGGAGADAKPGKVPPINSHELPR